MTEPQPPIDDRAFLSALLNIAIPPSESGDLPGAGTLGLEATVAAGVRADSMLGPMVEAGLQAVRKAAQSEHPDGLQGMSRQEGTDLVQAQLASHPMLMMGLLRHLYPAYYAHPRVLEAIGEPPRPPFPEGFEVEATEPELLERLRSRQKGK